MQEFTAEALAERRRTTLFITTDIDEAFLVADRVLVMSGQPTRDLEDITWTSTTRRRSDLLGDEQSQQAKRMRSTC